MSSENSDHDTPDDPSYRILLSDVDGSPPLSPHNHTQDTSHQNYPQSDPIPSDDTYDDRMIVTEEPLAYPEERFEIAPSSLTKEAAEEFYNKNQIKLHGENVPLPYATFKEMNLPHEIREAIRLNGWEVPTPIQSAAIPVALQGKDLIAIAKTGSGKTAAFLLPAIIRLYNSGLKVGEGGPLVLILSPTRELAQQTDTVTLDICRHSPIKHCCIFGGGPRNQQIDALRNSPHIVIGTPGRLIDFIDSGSLDLSRVNFLILDEADRMLDLGFEPQLRRIVSNVPQKRQTLMFSATWPKEIRQLATDFLTRPTNLQIGSQALTANPNINQTIEQVGEHLKLKRLIQILREDDIRKAIIFVRMKRTADYLTDQLNSSGIRAFSLHGDKAQQQRDYILSVFREQREAKLVATDVAARGIDVSDIDTVINFDFPQCIEDYVHRIGRTARGDRKGKAITFFTEENRGLSRKLVKILAASKQDVPSWLMEWSESANQFPVPSTRYAGRPSGFVGRMGGMGIPPPPPPLPLSVLQASSSSASSGIGNSRADLYDSLMRDRDSDRERGGLSRFDDRSRYDDRDSRGRYDDRDRDRRGGFSRDRYDDRDRDRYDDRDRDRYDDRDRDRYDDRDRDRYDDRDRDRYDDRDRDRYDDRDRDRYDDRDRDRYDDRDRDRYDDRDRDRYDDRDRDRDYEDRDRERDRYDRSFLEEQRRRRMQMLAASAVTAPYGYGYGNFGMYGAPAAPMFPFGGYGYGFGGYGGYGF